jgi:membrane protein DedA with SNARE-associated domain
MGILSGILGQIALFCIGAISLLGYFGVFFLMVLESIIFPMPSELVMPFAGFLVSTGEMTFLWVIISATLGSLVGSLLSYYLGMYGGKKFVVKYGKYLLLNEEHLMKTEKWFNKKGELTIFVGRFIPVIRHIISIPAGVGKMNIKKFILYTILGAGIWNSILTYVGFALGKNWEKIKEYSDFISWIALGIIIVVGAYFLWKELKKRKIKGSKRKIKKI